MCTVLFPKFSKILFILHLQVLMLFSHAQGSEVIDNTMTLLRKEKLLGYDPYSRPVKNHNHNTTVYTGLAAVNMDINDREQTLILVSYLSLMWNDEFMKWDPVNYDNITILHFDTNEVWTPDIVLYNSAKGADPVPKSPIAVVALHDGTMIWVPPFTVEVPCRLDLTYWPTDTHTCEMNFGSWAHHGELISLRIQEHYDPSGMSFKHYKPNDRWTVLNYSSYLDETIYGAESYHYIDFRITVQREAAAHATYVTQTTLALMLAVLVSYLLPLRYHLSRMLLHMFALSSLIACNLVLFLSLPSSGGNIPFVVRYYSGTIILTTMSLICTVVLATTQLSDGSNSQSEISRKLSSVLGFPNNSSNGRRQLVTAENIYSTLEEELKDMSDDHSAEPNNMEGNTAGQSSLASPVSMHKSSGLGFFRVANAVLFLLFTIAYFVDYIVLRSSIGK